MLAACHPSADVHFLPVKPVLPHPTWFARPACFADGKETLFFGEESSPLALRSAVASALAFSELVSDRPSSRIAPGRPRSMVAGLFDKFSTSALFIGACAPYCSPESKMPAGNDTSSLLTKSHSEFA